VLLRNCVYWKGETYFIDGWRDAGLLTWAIPVVEGRINCSRSNPVQNAIVDMRLLHESAPVGGT
jgi:hypothetical protein